MSIQKKEMNTSIDDGNESPRVNRIIGESMQYFSNVMPHAKETSEMKYSTKDCFDALEKALGSEGLTEELKKKGLDSAYFSSMELVTAGSEYFVFDIKGNPRFIANVSRSIEVNTVIKNDYETLKKFHEFEENNPDLNKIGHVVSPIYFHDGGISPSVTIAPHVDDISGVYVKQEEYPNYNTGRVVSIGKDSESEQIKIKNQAIADPNELGYLYQLEGENDLLGRIVDHQLRLSLSGVVNFANMNFADYSYDLKNNELYLTRTRSPKIAQEQYGSNSLLLAGMNYSDAEFPEQEYENRTDALFVQIQQLLFQVDRDKNGFLYPIPSIVEKILSIIETELSPVECETLMSKINIFEIIDLDDNTLLDIDNREGEEFYVFRGRLNKFKKRLLDTQKKNHKQNKRLAV